MRKRTLLAAAAALGVLEDGAVRGGGKREKGEQGQMEVTLKGTRERETRKDKSMGRFIKVLDSDMTFTPLVDMFSGVRLLKNLVCCNIARQHDPAWPKEISTKQFFLLMVEFLASAINPRTPWVWLLYRSTDPQLVVHRALAFFPLSLFLQTLHSNFCFRHCRVSSTST